MTTPQVAPPPADATSGSPAAIREALRRWYNALFDLWARDRSFLGTLTPSAASTTFTDARISPTSALVPQACTANAAAAITTLWIDETTRTRGVVTIRHSNTADTDRTYRWSILGP